jgi:lysine 2,3-aminomutase
VETGLKIVQALQGHTSGMAVPHFVIDAPGGGGKIPLLPNEYLLNLDEKGAVLKNFENKTYHYPQPTTTDHRELPMVNTSASRDMCSAGAMDDH